MYIYIYIYTCIFNTTNNDNNTNHHNIDSCLASRPPDYLTGGEGEGISRKLPASGSVYGQSPY